MPRIDPQQLLNCLQVLLTPAGGILSKDEVQRLHNLMTKFSKKLVSKCIYVLILKNTDKHLLGAFMAEGGWNLIHVWLQDAHLNKNWALVTEVLELLLITPVDVERLKMNNLPKLVKSLTKRDDLANVQQLATTLVDEWLKIVKDVTKAEAANQARLKQAEEVAPVEEVGEEQVVEEVNEVTEPMEVETSDNTSETTSENTDSTNSSLKFKVALKDGKQVISKVPAEGDVVNEVVVNNVDAVDTESDKDKKDDKKDKSKHRSSSSSRSSRDKDKDRSRDRSKHRSSSSRDKDKRDKHRSNGSSSSKHRSSSKSGSSSSKDKDKDKDKDKKENKEKQAEKDKDTLSKIQPHTLLKTGRIPKKNEEVKSAKQEEAKKPTFSVEVRKNSEEKPKTVKIFNSKMRSTGLLEEAKPPPPRTTATKKPPPVLPVLPMKRPSPIRDLIPPPEKKSRLLEVPDRPGAIKLIPPKPKPAVLQESDIFMDALTASATMKKETKKRKRRPSSSKELSPPTSPTPGTPTSPTTIKNITPANFYQDTLGAENEEEKEAKDSPTADAGKLEIPDTPAEPDEEASQAPVTKYDSNGLKGVLCHSKRKGPKRSLRWKPEAELVEIQYFELDETERVNVMKPFMDMARMEMTNEREAMRARKLPNEDVMDAQMPWKLLAEVEVDPKSAPQVEPGSKSSEKQIQFAREKRILQAIYFNNRIPDSPSEPDPENHPMVNTVTIPLEDPDNPDQDTPLQPWPEPKGSPPHVPNIPPMFQNLPAPPFMNMGGPPGPFPPGAIPPFPPNFMPPNRFPVPGQPDWNGMPNGMPPPNMPNMPPPDMMNPGPPMFDNFGPNMPENGFPPPFQPPNNNMPMFPPNNFNNMRGRGGFRRGGNNNSGPWVRMAGPNSNWNGPRGGGQNRGGRLCINIKKHGYCRNRDNCHFIHPN